MCQSVLVMNRMTEPSPYLHRMMRKTKIICTIGPASETEETLCAMMDAGMDVARINFSHGAYADHLEKINRIKKLRAEKGLAVSLLLDTKGPEVRLGTFAAGRVNLEAGAAFTLCMYDTEGDEQHVSVTYRELWKDITAGVN